MSIFFSAREIVQFAVRIEENGVKFYRHAARLTEDNDAKDLFDYLADEETSHKRLFENLLTKIGEYEPFENYSGEYLEYVKSYVDSIIFTNEVLDDLISKVKDTRSAIDFGIQRESDSLLYYHEIKNFVPKTQHNLINTIIDEERKHVVMLRDLRKKYG